jgi:hypothetical protein
MYLPHMLFSESADQNGLKVERNTIKMDLRSWRNRSPDHFGLKVLGKTIKWIEEMRSSKFPILLRPDIINYLLCCDMMYFIL